jgi:uncharacterized protein (TIGR00255 family)
MIKSMTGFGRSETVTEAYKLTVEMKAVNHRYCDIGLKLPKKFNAYENRIRSIVKEYASRGKIDIYISYEDYGGQKAKVNYQESVAKGYMEAIESAADTFGMEKGITALSLIRLPEVISLEEADTDEAVLYPILEENLRLAAGSFAQARCKEGEHLKNDLLEKLTHIEKMVEEVERRSPEMLAEYRQKITNKVEELLGEKNIDEHILATELAVFADKVCVDEETVRLRAHIQNMRDTLTLAEAVGRKLDFIAQEMNREANTILSKANDRELSNVAIDLKTEIEKVREQIQNIE